MNDLLVPEEKTFDIPDGSKKTYVLSKFPATVGREIVTQYPISATPKLGDYKVNEELMIKLMGYVAVVTDSGSMIRLSTRALVDNHVPDFETLMKIEMAMMEKNCSFFARGKVSNFFEGLAAKFQTLSMKTLTDFARQLSAKN